MVHQTEAACLLQNGALYLTRAGLQPSDGELIFAGFKQGAFSLYYGDEPIYHFDLDGRWQRAYITGTHFLKGLDTKVQAIERVREGPNLVLHRRMLSALETTELDAAIRSAVLELSRSLDERLTWLTPPSSVQMLESKELTEFLDRITAWDADAWHVQSEVYAHSYGPLPFLPPEAAQAVLFQATVGRQGWLFSDRRSDGFDAKSLTSFEDHARTIAALWGRRRAQARWAYLSGSNIWSRTVNELIRYVEVIAQVLPLRGHLGTDADSGLDRLDGVIGFLDDYSMPLPDAEGWVTLAQRSLTLMVLGLESGSAEVRRLYGRDWENSDLGATAAALSEAGIGTSVAVLVNAGGLENAQEHVAATVDLVNRLELAHGSNVYLLDLAEVGGDVGLEKLRAAGLSPVDGSAYKDVVAQLKLGLAPIRKERGVKVVTYSLDKQGR
jgi:hypothetical protein